MRPHNQPGAFNQALASDVLDWLIRDWQFFGFTGQIWMPVFAAGLVLYIAVLILARYRRSGLR